MDKRSYSVLLVDLAKTYGGAEVRVLTACQALQNRTAVCRVATLEGSALHARLQARDLPFELIKVSRSNPRLMLELRNLIKRGSYQIVDAHNVQSILWGHLAAKLAGAKGRVATIHSDFAKEYPGLKGRGYAAILSIDKWLARQFINVTEVLQARSQANGTADRSSLILNAVPVPETIPTVKDDVLRAEWGFTPGDFVVGIVARLKPVKGHTYLIDALAKLADFPQVKLLILGDGTLREALEAQANERNVADRVCFTGFREDIPRVLESLDCVCMASLSEALPYAILEAAAYARPILATAVGGMATLLTDYKTARLVPARDPAALAEGLRWIVTHPDDARQMGINAYHMVRQSCSVQTMIEKTLQIYDKALA
ncbi:MAG: glycosyltransferase [Aggregatilineales bacterium]